jgi:hypothetical protein
VFARDGEESHVAQDKPRGNGAVVRGEGAAEAPARSSPAIDPRAVRGARRAEAAAQAAPIPLPRQHLLHALLKGRNAHLER